MIRMPYGKTLSAVAMVSLDSVAIEKVDAAIVQMRLHLLVELNREQAEECARQ